MKKSKNEVLNDKYIQSNCSNINWTQWQLYSALDSDFEISDNLIEKAKSSTNHKGFTVINDKFILIEDDKSLIWDIEKCKRLRENSVNYCGPISYKEYDWNYYFVEHKAPWIQLDYYNYDGKIPYNEAFKKYFSILELLSKASQKQYYKFFNDIKAMQKESLRPDYCSLWNLFFDPDVWFSFIDVYPCNIRPWDEKLSLDNIFNMILNPKFSYKGLYIIPKEEVDKYNKVIKVIYDKIILALKAHDYSDDELEKFLKKGKHVFSDDECINYKDIEKYIKEHYNPFSIMIQM